jgi:hypothetical protein
MALAGAVSNLSFVWVDGIDASSDGVGNGDANEHHLTPAEGSWAAHMHALEMIVGENLDSALIMEDDVDWDVQLKNQMEAFGKVSRAWLEQFDETMPAARYRKEAVSRVRQTVSSPSLSPYGAGWDVLWLGHCGTDIPTFFSSPSPSSFHQQTPHHPLQKLRPHPPHPHHDGHGITTVLTITDDMTVPAPRHLRPHPFAGHDALAVTYPPHTRLVHAAGSGTVCSLAYAVSGRGARRLLARFFGAGGGDAKTQWDLTLGAWCGGDGGRHVEPRRGGPPYVDGAGRPVCVTVQPPLVSHHYPKDASSDIQGVGGGYLRGKVGTPYVRRSVRMNLDRLVAGDGVGDGLVDQWPDEGKTAW